MRLLQEELSSSRGMKRALSAGGQLAEPKRRSLDRPPLPQPRKGPLTRANRPGSAPRSVPTTAQQQPSQVFDNMGHHSPRPQRQRPWQRSDSFTAEVADLSEAAFAPSAASADDLASAVALHETDGATSDSDMSSGEPCDQHQQDQHNLQILPHLRSTAHTTPSCIPNKRALARFSADDVGLRSTALHGCGGSSEQLQPRSPPAPQGAALNELLDNSVRELGGLTLITRQSAPAALLSGCAATVAALNESLSTSCLQSMTDAGSDAGDEATGGSLGGVPVLQTMLSAASQLLVVPPTAVRQ